MSKRPIFPLLVAGVTGILSGVYIFKPLLDNQPPSADQPTNVRSNETVPSPNPQQPSDGTGTATPQRAEALSQNAGAKSK
ncbi:hypothetical protein BDY19DRAFT_1052328 [Irpex rosettiformis]|uniref:Uncharacterized protein n=1 Tax=Irpex rosettiformis TaxID=378272 RepID=A0ACB8UJC7_9APHY|nr:hypothetical protein BDY19DRAFT_1052328 [Irpex rosettiformis]